MKKIIVFTILTLLLISSAISFSGSGTGTSGSPYIITTPSQLNEMRDELTANYTLGNDIDMSGFGNWTPVGNWTIPFTGTFDGNGYNISNLYISVTAVGGEYPWGLFGTVDTSTYIGNVNIDNILIEEQSGATATECCLGALIGGIDSDLDIIENVHVTGTINTPTMEYVGGLYGYANVAQVANNYLHIVNSSFDGDIDGRNVVGGIGGDCNTVNMTEVWTSGTIYATLLGTGDRVGGLCGEANVGGTADNARFTDVYSTMDIDVNDTALGIGIGGLVGKTQTVHFNNAYYSGSITRTGSTPVDNLFVHQGIYTYSAQNLYFDEDANAFSSDKTNVTALTTAQSYQEASYTGFDFTNTWAVDEGVNTPVFQYQFTVIVTPPAEEQVATTTQGVNAFVVLLGIAFIVLIGVELGNKFGVFKGVKIGKYTPEQVMIAVLFIIAILIIITYGLMAIV
jgi:hypothetical protein